MTYDGDGFGNLTSKSDIGGPIGYGENNHGPNALTSISSLLGYKPANQQITYNEFNKVSQIKDSLASGTEIYLDIIYGIDDQRRQSVYTENSVAIREKRYFGEYEELIENNEIKVFNYIYSPSGLCAIYEFDKGFPSGPGNKLWHVNTDYLGSIAYMFDSDNYSNYKEQCLGNSPQSIGLGGSSSYRFIC
jgi:hypothetical protein